MKGKMNNIPGMSGKGKGRGRSQNSGLTPENLMKKTSGKDGRSVEKITSSYQKYAEEAEKANEKLRETRQKASDLILSVQAAFQKMNGVPETLMERLEKADEKRRKYTFLTPIPKKDLRLDKNDTDNAGNLGNLASAAGKMGKSSIGKGIGIGAAGAGKGAMAGKAAMTAGMGSGAGILGSLAGPVGVGLAGAAFMAYKSGKDKSRQKEFMKAVKAENNKMVRVKREIENFERKTLLTMDELKKAVLRAGDLFEREYEALSEEDKTVLKEVLEKTEKLSKQLSRKLVLDKK